MQTAVKTKKPRKQAISGRFWAGCTYRKRIKDDHKIDRMRILQAHVAGAKVEINLLDGKRKHPLSVESHA